MPIISFVKPFYLTFLAFIPLIILAHFLTLKRRRSQALKFANFDAIARIRGIDLLSKNLVVLGLTILLVALITLSLSGMTILRNSDTSAISFVIAIDTSRSMEATDFAPNRFEAAKATAITFINSAPFGTNIGVISFSGNSFIEATITPDKTITRNAVQGIPLSSIGGTDISEAIITSTNLLEGQESKSIILLSDGRLNVGSIANTIDYANLHAVTVHTIAIGTVEGGETSFGLSKLDEEVLKASAYNTGGQFFSAENKETLEESLLGIMDIKVGKIKQNVSSQLLIAALIIFMIEYVLINTRYRVLP